MNGTTSTTARWWLRLLKVIYFAALGIVVLSTVAAAIAGIVDDPYNSTAIPLLWLALGLLLTAIIFELARRTVLYVAINRNFLTPSLPRSTKAVLIGSVITLILAAPIYFLHDIPQKKASYEAAKEHLTIAQKNYDDCIDRRVEVMRNAKKLASDQCNHDKSIERGLYNDCRADGLSAAFCLSIHDYEEINCDADSLSSTVRNNFSLNASGCESQEYEVSRIRDEITTYEQ
jgi:hypothetical protein